MLPACTGAAADAAFAVLLAVLDPSHGPVPPLLCYPDTHLDQAITQEAQQALLAQGLRQMPALPFC